MPSLDDLNYFRIRSVEERQRASEATDPDVRRMHLDLARRYVIASSGQDLIEQTREAISRSFSLLSATRGMLSD